MLNFQEMVAKLLQFWAAQGCAVHQGYDLEVGAGTFNPATFLRCLGPEPYSAVYVEPSRRPKDGRYGENPNRVQFYHQMQVILKPSPPNIQDLYLHSLETIGMELNQHDMRFVHDDWENPTIGAWGLGWEIWSDGMEISQFTYFQAVGGLPVSPVSGEITYGLERLAMYIQNVDSMFDLKWNDEITYGDIFKRSEWEWSHYNFSAADSQMWLRHFDDYEKETMRLVQEHLPIPAYDFVMKASHAFNMLDARGVISVTERTNYIGRIRNLAKIVAEGYIQSREKLQFPLLRIPKSQFTPAQLPPPLAQCDPNERKDFLLEIGSEELPATFVPIGMQQLEQRFSHLLNEEAIAFDALSVFGTPRRLSIYLQGLAGGTAAKQIERKGPALSAAFDPQGEPTKAGEGFFRSLHLPSASLEAIQKGEVKGIEIRKNKEIPYLFASYEQPGISTRTFLAERLPKLILEIEFPKKMRWADLTIEYARPLRWITCLYGKEVIPFSIGTLTSSHHTYGHRQLAHYSCIVSEPKEYVELLRKHWVMVDVKERRECIEQQLLKIEQHLKAHAVAKERVMPQVLHLVEWPFLAVGHFDKAYLQTPQEVLISEMVEHQKYFPTVDQDKKLQPHFVIVCNNRPTDLIRAGNQKALAPRLADGMFLYEEDLKQPLDHFNEKLKTVIFQKKLGSVWDKAMRLRLIIEKLHAQLPLCELSFALRAATLSKADLASNLVGEFPELQGVIGRLYALKQGENQEVAEAIDEQWMPRGEKAPLPKSGCGTLLSLTEKIDNFLTCYALDLKPTSSSDPYALRRQAIGMLKMIIDGKHALSLHRAFREGVAILLHAATLTPELKEEIGAKQEALLEEIFAFLSNRLRTILGEYGFEKDEIEAVLVRGPDRPYAIYCRAEALHAFRTAHPSSFSALYEVYTRTRKILFSQNPQLLPKWKSSYLSSQEQAAHRFGEVNPEEFKDPSEKRLFDKLQEMKKLFYKQLSTDLGAAFAAVATLQEPLRLLFEEVKIMDENLQVRANRLGLLQEVWDLCEELVDFSKVVQVTHD